MSKTNDVAIVAEEKATTVGMLKDRISEAREAAKECVEIVGANNIMSQFFQLKDKLLTMEKELVVKKRSLVEREYRLEHSFQPSTPNISTPNIDERQKREASFIKREKSEITLFEAKIRAHRDTIDIEEISMNERIEQLLDDSTIPYIKVGPLYRTKAELIGMVTKEMLDKLVNSPRMTTSGFNLTKYHEDDSDECCDD